MATTRKIVKVFLASPGDLGKERRAAKEVIDTFNKQWADWLHVHVELVGWEDTVSQIGRPQEIINRDLDQCDLFIGMMWERWGSPPGNDGRYTSGFEEEFERSMARHKSTGKPEISLFFKDFNPKRLEDPGESLQKVIAFKERIAAEKSVLYQTFSETEFEDRLRSCITNYVQSVQSKEAQQGAEETQTRPTNEPSVATSSAPPPVNWLGPEGSEFVRGLLPKLTAETPDNRITSIDVARFRLASTIVNLAGNDDVVLGTHDANLLFFQREGLKLGVREMSGLIESSLARFSQEVVPLWHWYKQAGAKDSHYLSIVSIIGSDRKKIGALKAMRLLCEPLSPDVERDVFLESWLRKDTDTGIKTAALEYLAKCGMTSDLPRISEEFASGNSQTANAATEAMIALNLRHSKTDAIRVLFDLQPERVDVKLLNELFSRPQSINKELLLQGVTHRSPAVRKVVVSALAHADRLSSETAEKLLDDSEPAIRYLALKTLISAGRQYSNQAARSILVMPKSSPPFGFGYRPFGSLLSDEEGEKYWHKYKMERLRSLPDSTLNSYIQTQSIFDRDAQFALDCKHFTSRRGALKGAIENRFKSIFDSNLAEKEESSAPDNETIKRVRSQEEATRKKFTREALDIVCEKGDERDLATVREVLRSGFIEHSEDDLDFLRRHGEWADIDLLIALADSVSSNSLSILMISEGGKIGAIAATISSLARGRLPDLLRLEMSNDLKTKLIASASDADIEAVDDQSLLSLLDDANASLRKTVALKAVKSLSKRRVSALLERYTRRPTVYYNVIYWLDFGVSIQKKHTASVAASLLNNGTP